MRKLKKSEVVSMLREVKEKTASTVGFFIGHVTQFWVINDLLGTKEISLKNE